MEEASVPSLLTPCLSALAEKIENSVKVTREEFKSTADLYEFLKYRPDGSRGVSQLYALTPGYVECMKTLGVSTKAELQQLWANHYESPGVQDAVEKLQIAEKKFVEFTTEIEHKLLPFENKLTVKDSAKAGDMLPKDHPLIEIPSGHPITLESCLNGAKFTLFVLLRMLG
jgi:hypothetical protein